MMAGHPLLALSAAWESALRQDLKPIQLQMARPRRPTEDECEVYLFMQTLGSTALGFGGIGGQAITSAYTTVVLGPCRDAAVYFNGRLAYTVDRISQEFMECVRRHEMPSRARLSSILNDGIKNPVSES